MATRMQQIGRFQILGELGRGAMGIVYRALDPAIGRPVAIKTIRLSEISDPAERERLRERLFREAQSAGLLSHPGIVTIYDVGEQDGVTYIAMEFVSGPTLEYLMTGEQPLAPAQVIDMLRQTAAALDFAHKKGIVHRDIKPANIMVGEDGVVKITDFGVAKISQAQQVTQAGVVIGTPNYMSPEQVRGKPVDGRADQFSLAVVTYEMLTGERPFPGDTLTQVVYKIVSEDPAPPQTLNSSLPWAVGMVLSRALSKDPAKRFPAATDLVNALEAALGTKKDWKPLPRGAVQTAPTAIAPAFAHRPPAHEEPPTRSRREVEEPGGGLFWKIAGAALAGLAVVGVLFFAAQRYLGLQQETPRETPATPAPQADAARPAPMPPAQNTPTPGEGPQQQAPTETPAASAPSGDQAEPRTDLPKSDPVKPKPRPQEPAPPSEYALQVVTSPPGAEVRLNEDPARSCQTPCSLTLSAGRHVIAVTLEGYRKELRIVDLKGPEEVFVNMAKAQGTVRVESQPPGAQILINGQARPETTPAAFQLPVGKYRITVIRDGRRADQEIEVKDGSLLRFQMEIPQ